MSKRKHTDTQVVDLMLKNRFSLSRFGDGEFQWMTGEGTVAFQHSSQELSSRLREVFSSEIESLLIGIPKGIFDSSKNNLYSKMHWRIIRENYLHRLSMFIQDGKQYADASITRHYIDWHYRKESKLRFNNLKRIWDKHHVVIVERKGTQLGVGNDLLSNLSKGERRCV